MSEPEFRFELTPLTYNRWRIIWTDGHTNVEKFW